MYCIWRNGGELQINGNGKSAAKSKVMTSPVSKSSELQADTNACTTASTTLATEEKNTGF